MADQPPILSGRVAPGDRRGRTMGFPTANIALNDDTPGVDDGVWAAVVVLDGRAHPATVSIGRRPTFYAADGERLLEAFLLDFSGDLYGQDISVELRRYLRPQRRFASEAALIARIRRDVVETRAWAASRQGVVALDRRGPLAAERRRQKRAARAVRTEQEVGRAIRDLAPGEITHEAVAARVNAPVGLLRWTYPTIDELTRAERAAR